MALRTYQTLSIATEELRKNGYSADFKLEDGEMKCTENGKAYTPNDMQIIEFHRFEGDSDPADMSIVYAIECSDGTKGSIVGAYGTYGSVRLDDYMKEVKVADRTDAAKPIHERL